MNEWLETFSPRDRELVELRAAGHDLDESAEKLGTSRFMVCRRIKELDELLAEHADMPDCVYRRQWKRSRAGEEAPPESGVQMKKTRSRASRPGGCRTRRDAAENGLNPFACASTSAVRERHR
ncbi:hypothetical protein [Polyangium sp. 15x6]|uniref:hypothetical protein n=1 Tax=Polyangium sp. 15x6 TaxID=3042687 RepID=UPI00249A0E61|nr:hypothetical protein [Polyangium sp. 15x6]MDI3284717.1 hypothetical protein [Polyangium sp. 15x6]